MNNDELKKKIMKVLKEAMEPIEYGGDSEHAPEVHYPTEDEIADALIAAGIGDTEWQHDVFKKTYMDFIAKLHYDKKFFKRFDDVSLGCKLVMFEDILDQNKKEFV